LRKVHCLTCRREFILYQAYRKFKGEYLPIRYTPRCPDCQTEYYEKPKSVQSALKPKTMKKTKSKLKPRRNLKKKFSKKTQKSKLTALTLTKSAPRKKPASEYYHCL
jgi:hypothetical protein